MLAALPFTPSAGTPHLLPPLPGPSLVWVLLLLLAAAAGARRAQQPPLQRASSSAA
jgi:hypothetical protein